jgi:hypothetical protein
MRIGRLIEKAATEPRRHRENSKLNLSQRSREQRGDNAPDRCLEPQRQERYHHQSRSRIQPTMRDTRRKRLGQRPPIIYGIRVVRHDLALHQFPPVIWCTPISLTQSICRRGPALFRGVKKVFSARFGSRSLGAATLGSRRVRRATGSRFLVLSGEGAAPRVRRRPQRCSALGTWPARPARSNPIREVGQ